MNDRPTPSRSDRELTLTEMLVDPIIRAVMTRDGVTKQEVEALLVTVRVRIGHQPITGCEICRQKVGIGASIDAKRQQPNLRTEERRL